MKTVFGAIACVSVVALLGGCASGIISNTQTQINSVNDALITDLGKIAATATADLQQVEKVASVPNARMPGGIEDQDGYNCAAAAITVGAQIQAVMAAGAGPGAGIMTTAEIASLFQPGSAQYNQAKQTLTSGCAAKAQDVLGAAGVLAAGGVVGAIATGQVLPILAAAP